MKTILVSTLCLTLFAQSPFAQQKRSAEETAITQTIEAETHWFNRRDQVQWADCFVHNDEVFCSWASPASGKNSAKHLEGWKAVSSDFKSRMETLPVQLNDAQKTHYQIEINNDRAYVTFQESGKSHLQIRVLKNIDDQWKILRMESLESQTEDFAKK